MFRFAKPILLTCICNFLIDQALAQKLPGKQTVSLRTPSVVKVDGKAAEWDYKFQAYNDATELYYTVANNDTELYLTVYCVQRTVIKRIMDNGLSFTIHKSGKKKDSSPIVITYPVFDKNNRFYPEFISIPAIQAGARPPMPVVEQVRFAPPGVIGMGAEKPLTDPVSDSLLNVNNTRFAAKSKSIAVVGIKGLDNLTSVYNDEGIKASGQFDKKMAYTYEFTISLKHLGLSAADAAKFAYQLRVNDAVRKDVYVTNEDTGERSLVGGAATDFWGEYTLAKP